MSRRRNAGFTIVEALLAMAIFSFVIVTIIVAFRQMMSSYRHGVVSQQTQELAREITDRIGKESRSSDSVTVVRDASAEITFLCFEDTQFEYHDDSGDLRLGTNISSACNQTDSAARSLIDNNLQVTVFDVERVSSPSPDQVALGINLRLVVATDSTQADGVELLDSTRETCDPTQPGAQYCATTVIQTSIGLRSRSS